MMCPRCRSSICLCDFIDQRPDPADLVAGILIAACLLTGLLMAFL